jgi:hypothetical protein
MNLQSGLQDENISQRLNSLTKSTKILVNFEKDAKARHKTHVFNKNLKSKDLLSSKHLEDN